MRTFLICTAFCVAAMQASGQRYKPVNISLSEGLSQSCVYSIVQDAQGFVWMATQDGLNRYDGIHFEVYRNEPFDTNTLSTNFIRRLFIDSRSWLWIVTQHQGLSLFIPATSGFRHFTLQNYPGLGHNNINAIAEDSKGRLWLATQEGIASARVHGGDPASAEIVFTRQEAPTGQSGIYPLFHLFIDKKDNLWTCTGDSLFMFRAAGAGIRTVNSWNIAGTPGLEAGEITAFSQDDERGLWISSSHGVSLYDYGKGQFASLTGSHPVLKKGIGGDYISAVFAGRQGALWVGTATNGLYQLRRNTPGDPLNEYIAEKMSLGASRHSNMVLSIHEDRINPGMLWVGTFAGGTYKLIPVLKNFKSDFLEYPGVESPLVTAIRKDARGIVWVGTPTGLYRYSRPRPGEGGSAGAGDCRLVLKGYISAILEDESGIWVSGEYGIYLLKQPYSGKPVPVRYKGDSEDDGMLVRALYQDPDRRLFAIFRLRIYVYDRTADRFVPFCNAPDTTHRGQRGYALSAMLIDSRKNLWIGSTMGLSLFPADRNGDDGAAPRCYYHKLQDTASLRSHTIQSLMEDTKGNVWIGTSNGLTRAYVDSSGVRFRNFSSANNIKNNLVYSVVEDPQTGFLWLSTNGGLTRFDPAGALTANFDINDGLQSNEFNAGAYSRSTDGELFFGGIQGFTSFYPSQIRTDTVPPRVFITRFVSAGNGNAIEKDKNGNKTVTLKSFENSFAIDFIGLQYRDPLKNQYAYRLEGFQPDWTSCGHSRQVNFSQLSPGTYVFEVIASNNDGIFSTAGDKLTIVIHPPFYQTIWFYLLLLAFTAIVLWLLHMYRLKMKMERVNEIEKIRKETAADFHDELGHKLTTISWFSDITRKKLRPDQSELKGYLNKIIETSGNMYLTMKDLLWAMDPEKDSVYHTYHQLIRFGHELFDHTGIEFTADAPAEELKEIDLPLAYKRHILLIFKEIMHNSLKHGAPANTYLALERSNGTLTVRFGDDGTGFSAESASQNGHGHGIKNVMRRAELIHADAAFRPNGQGTTFELNLKLNKYKN